MITLYGLNEQEWLNLAVIAGWCELSESLLYLKSKYHNCGAQSQPDMTDAEMDACRIFMVAKLHCEIFKLGGKL